jgi:hypothetical protein
MRNLTLFVFILSIVLISCRKEQYQPNSASQYPIPNSVGDYWKYSIQTPNGNPAGYLEVGVIAKTTLPNGNPVTTWVYTYPAFTDTIYKVLSDTSFSEYYNNPILNDSYSWMRYQLPIAVGNQYSIDPSIYSDSVIVVSDSLLTVSAGTFKHAIEHDIVGSHYIGNYFNHSRYWFTPNIGNTRMEIVIYNLRPDVHNGIYELVEYRLK